MSLQELYCVHYSVLCSTSSQFKKSYNIYVARIKQLSEQFLLEVTSNKQILFMLINSSILFIHWNIKKVNVSLKFNVKRAQNCEKVLKTYNRKECSIVLDFSQTFFHFQGKTFGLLRVKFENSTNYCRHLP